MKTLWLTFAFASVACAAPMTPPPASPSATPVPGAFGTAELDASIAAKTKAKGLTASGACDDATFLRRLSLDLNGVIPTPADVETFLQDTRADKRQLKIDELLAKPEFDRHWATQMRSYMMGKAEAKAIQVFARKGIEEWFEERMRARDGYDKIVAQLITAEGAFIDNPATGFMMKKDATPEDLTARTGKVFLGAQIMCAQCHDHPFEKWKQTDFYGMVSFFSRTRTAPLPEPALELVRKNVPVPMIRMLLMGGGGQGPQNLPETLPNGQANPFAGKPGKLGKGKGGKLMARFAQMTDEQKVQLMMRRMQKMDGAGMGLGATDDDAPDAVPQATPKEILDIANRVKAQIAAAMPIEGAEPEPGAKKAKKNMRRIPVVFEAPRGEAVIPDPNATNNDNPKKPKGKQVAPRFLDGTTPTGTGKRRQQLAEWLTAPANPYFARAAVNRFFGLLVGQPLVTPIDNTVNPADSTLNETLDALAAAFVKSGYDLRWLCRTIVNSQAYQRDLAATKGAERDRALLTHANPRQLSPEQLFASFLQATGAEEMARGVMGDRFERLKEGFLRQFVFTFENDEGAEVEVFHETIPQALMLMNSGLINRPVQAGPGGMLAKVAASSSDPAHRIDQLYLATLSRHARPEEIAKLVEVVNARAGRNDPDMPGMDDPPAVGARDFLEDLPRGGGRRFGGGLGAMAQLRNWRQRFGMGPKGDPGANETGGWAAMTGMKARWQKRFGRGPGGAAGASGAEPGADAGPFQGGRRRAGQRFGRGRFAGALEQPGAGPGSHDGAPGAPADEGAAVATPDAGVVAGGPGMDGGDAGTGGTSGANADPNPSTGSAREPGAAPAGIPPAPPSAVPGTGIAAASGDASAKPSPTDAHARGTASPSPAIVVGPNPWKSPGERQAYEDIFWSLVSCSEFLYNH